MAKQLHVVETEPGASAEWVDLSPELAEQWLGHNKKNRNLRWRKVTEMARDMTEGRWQVNGDPIRFDTNRDLIDGQHRLHAVIQSGVTIRVLVVRSLAPEAQDTIDIGARRSAGDALRLRGKSDSITLAAVARKVLIWRAGFRNFKGIFTPTQAEIVDLVATDPGVEEAAQVAAHYRSWIAAPSGVVGLAYWMFANLDHEDADEFIDKLASGENLGSGNPMLMLRRRLIDLRADRARLPDEDVLRGFIRAWNAYREKRTLDRLLLTTGKPNEIFPEPR